MLLLIQRIYLWTFWQGASGLICHAYSNISSTLELYIKWICGNGLVYFSVLVYIFALNAEIGKFKNWSWVSINVINVSIASNYGPISVFIGQSYDLCISWPPNIGWICCFYGWSWKTILHQFASTYRAINSISIGNIIWNFLKSIITLILSLIISHTLIRYRLYSWFLKVCVTWHDLIHSILKSLRSKGQTIFAVVRFAKH